MNRGVAMLRTSKIVAIVLCLASGLCPNFAKAQAYGDSLGRIYLTRDPSVDPWDTLWNWEATCIDDPGLAPFTPLEFYLVIHVDYADLGRPELNATHGFDAWEGRVYIPSQLTVLERTLQTPSLFPPPTEDNWIVYLADPVIAASTPVAVVKYKVVLLEAARNLWLRIGPPDPPNMIPFAPGWRENVPSGECAEDDEPVPCVRPFREWDGCLYDLVINYAGFGGCACRCICDPVQKSSWGAVKSRF
jgi:hypothetical protein